MATPSPDGRDRRTGPSKFFELGGLTDPVADPAATAADPPAPAPTPAPAAAPPQRPAAIDLAGWGTAAPLTEGDLRVVELDLAPGVGARLVSPPVGPAFTGPTLTGLGPGGFADGPSLSVGGYAIREHRGAAVMWGTSRGPGHADFAEPCQDVSAGRRVGDDVVLLAVADGISQGPKSGEVAAHAVSFGLNWLEKAVARGTAVESVKMGACVTATNRALERKAARLGDQRNDADATTVVFAAVDLRRRVANVCRVGDATAWVLHATDGLRPLFTGSKERSDGLVSGASLALPSATPVCESPDVVVDFDDVVAVMVCSDGVGDELVNGGSRFARWLAGFLAEPVDPLSFAYWLCMRIRGASDDRGAAVCWLPPTARADDNS